MTKRIKYHIIKTEPGWQGKLENGEITFVKEETNESGKLKEGLLVKTHKLNRKY